MLGALADDAAALGIVPDVLLDDRISLPPSVLTRLDWRSRLVRSRHEERDALERVSPTVDWVIVLAPETSGWLHARAGWVDQAGGGRLGPPLRDLTTAGDKQLTAERLAAHRVPTPPGGLISPGERFPAVVRLPLVLKPRDGAGSTETRLAHDLKAAYNFLENFSRCVRWEEFCPGLAVSVACLCGPPRGPTPGDGRRVVSLPACRQHIELGDGLTYSGGSLPLAPDLDARARRLAERAVRTLDAPLGWIGVDLVLGDSPDGSSDVVIEINPRYTTSLVGLRAALGVNLLQATLQIAEGRPTPELDAALARPPRPVEFDPDGTVRVL